jgi:hypothetical protein
VDDEVDLPQKLPVRPINRTVNKKGTAKGKR